MKQILTTIIAILASLDIAFCYDFKYNDFYCTITSDENKTVSVSAYSNESYYNSNSTFFDLTIPQRISNNGTIYTITSIGSFRNSKNLTSVSIPASVTSIGSEAFDGCTGLTSVIIPSSVTSIDSFAFSGCTGLEKVYISDISAWCNIYFDVFESNPLYYAHHLYLNDEEVRNLVIPENIVTINDHAFRRCTGLTSVSIPSSVTYIGEYAFKGCTGLTSVNIPSSVTVIEHCTFDGCTGLTSVSIPSSVTSIESSAFYGCTGLTSVSIPSSVTAIEHCAFRECTGLTSMSIPPSVTTIGEEAYEDCTGLTSVSIPSSVSSIDEKAFHGCTRLESVTCMWDEPITTEENIFSNETYKCPLYVPVGTKDKYDNTVPWYRFSQIIEKYMNGVDDINLSQEAEVRVVDGTICVSGDEPVRIVTMNGATVYSGHGDCSVNVAKGIYIVIVGGKAHKVSV